MKKTFINRGGYKMECILHEYMNIMKWSPGAGVGINAFDSRAVHRVRDSVSVCAGLRCPLNVL